MGFDLRRLTVKNVDTPPIRLPTRNTRRVTLIRIGNTGVMLFLEFVFHRVGSGVAAKPKLLDELLAFFVGFQRLICSALFARDNVGYVFVKPFPEHPARSFLFARPFGGVSLFRVLSL